MLTIRVTGTEEVARRLDSVAGALDDELELALVTGALEIQNGAKARCPYFSGTLRRSIHVGGHTHNGVDGGDIGGNRGGRNARVLVGTDVPYAKYVEFGTSRMAARSYLRAAANEDRDACVAAVAGAIRDLLGQAGR